MYAESTKNTQVALEGFPSGAPSFEGALCAGNTQFDWVPDEEPTTLPEAQKALCRACPMVQQCLQWATTTGAVGIWGGTTAAERRYKPRSTDAPAPLHPGPGDDSFYRQGCRCVECRAAQAAKMRRQRHQRRQRQQRKVKS